MEMWGSRGVIAPAFHGDAGPAVSPSAPPASGAVSVQLSDYQWRHYKRRWPGCRHLPGRSPPWKPGSSRLDGQPGDVTDMPIPPVPRSGPAAWPKTGRFPVASRHPPVSVSVVASEWELGSDTWDAYSLPARARASRQRRLGRASDSRDPMLWSTITPKHRMQGCRHG